MRGILGILLPPLLALLIAGGRKRKSAVFLAAEYLAYMAIIACISMMTMIPLERISMRVNYGEGSVYLDYGCAALAVSCVLGLIVGAAARAVRAKSVLVASVEPREAKNGRKNLLHLPLHLLWICLMILLGCYCWALSEYGNITFEEMVFHLRMPLQGTAESFVGDLITEGVLPGAVAALLILLLVYAPGTKSWWVRHKTNPRIWVRVLPLRLPVSMTMAAIVCMSAVMLLCADQNFTFSEFVINQFRQSHLIEEEYVDPVSVRLTFPQEKRNLITIYMESAETTSQDKANGGIFDVNYTPEMTRLAKENVSFSHSELIEGAAVAPACGWTIAGLVAQTAGLPLKLYRYDDAPLGVDNAMDRQSTFMPGATALGDILRDEGYHNVFLCGSESVFGGRRLFFEQHGGYEILDYPLALETGRIPPDYLEFWGFEDEKLYTWAREALLELADGDQPFNFTMLTVDTHAPEGYTCRLCPNTYEDPFANLLACSSKQLDDFISWCREQEFYENTSIVIVGDHASMVAGFYSQQEYDKHNGSIERKVYNAFINSAALPYQEKNRQFTTLDFFPTTLASMGVEIEGNRLGLGTNLFSDRETLAEEYGYDVLFDELNRKSTFYDNHILYP